MPRDRIGMLCSLILACGLAVAAAPPTRGDDLKADVDHGKKLLAEGDALGDKGNGTEAQVRYQQAFEHLLPGLRKLPFKHEVKRDITAREDLRAFLIKDIDADMSPEELRAAELGLRALGFIPADLNWKDAIVKVYSEEIAAFYDPRTKTMHLIKEPEAAAKKSPSFLERLLGKTGGFDKDENQTVIAHELTHALADQHFDLDAMHKAVKDDDDMDLALSALIEGEATLAMMGAQMKDWDGSMTKDIPADDLDFAFGLVGTFLPMMSGKSLRDAPPILAETMLFPYIKGMVFCAKLVNRDGWPAVDAAYKNPPLSSEQVLHPDKYKLKPDAPMTIDLGKLEPGAGWKEAGRNVVGELQLSVLLKKHNGRKAAAGWDGDRYAVFEGPEGALGLVWLSTWDSENDAREFAESYARFQTTKLEKGATTPDDIPANLTRERDGRGFAIERRGADVAVVEGFPRAATQALIDSALKARKTEKTWDPRAGSR